MALLVTYLYWYDIGHMSLFLVSEFLLDQQISPVSDWDWAWEWAGRVSELLAGDGAEWILGLAETATRKNKAEQALIGEEIRGLD